MLKARRNLLQFVLLYKRIDENNNQRFLRFQS